MNTVKVQFNKLLQRQIQKKLGSEDELPEKVLELLQQVSLTYDQYERERMLTERSLDISSQEMADANRQLEQQKHALERSNEELRQFAFAVSHDLKEPLRTIAGFIQLVELRIKDHITDETKEYMDFAVKGVKQMQEMLEAMLKYAQLDGNDENFADLDLNLLIDEALAALQDDISASNAQVICVNALPKVTGSRNQLLQLFENLISNSLRFKSEKTPVIEVTYTDKGRFYEFVFRDNGIGISYNAQKRIFDMFTREHKDGKYQGIGMGLTYCKKIVENHGGHIRINPDPAHNGLEVCFTLPK